MSDKSYTVTLINDSADINTAMTPSGIPDYTVDSSVGAVHIVTMDESWGRPFASMVTVDNDPNRPQEFPLISSVAEN